MKRAGAIAVLVGSVLAVFGLPFLYLSARESVQLVGMIVVCVAAGLLIAWALETTFGPRA